MTDRSALEDLDTEPEPARWYCTGNAEDCPLCDTAALPYPWICPGHPDTGENRQRTQAAAEPELTVDEARDLVSDLSTDLYWAQDRLGFVGECCDIADREQRPITTADVREWLKGARCGRQLAADAAATTEAAESAPWPQLEAHAFNAVQPALREAGERLPLSARRAVARAVLAAVQPHLAGHYQHAVDAVIAAEQRADRAEATVARVRAALPPYDKPVHGDTGRGMQMGWDRARQAALDALDGERSAPAPAATDPLTRYRDWLADEFVKAEARDQATGEVPPELRISPHNGIASGIRTALHGLDRILARPCALDGEQPAPAPAATEAGGAVCTVTVTVHAPTGENAASWAQTVSDLVAAEYGQEMRLNIQIDRPRKACCGKDIGHHIFCPTRQAKEQP